MTYKNKLLAIILPLLQVDIKFFDLYNFSITVRDYSTIQKMRNYYHFYQFTNYKQLPIARRTTRKELFEQLYTMTNQKRREERRKIIEEGMRPYFKTDTETQAFVSRPLYAFVFSIISIYCLLSGLFIVTGNVDYIINEKFLYLCAIISSFIGYSVGHVLDRFETISQEQIEHIR